MSEPSDLNSWAKLLKENWEKRSRSDSRDFFVASHPGWQDEETVRRKAKTELDLVLANLDSKFLSQKQVLEIGCGPGRLAQYVGPRVLGYTGIDIAEGMIQGAH